LIILLETEFMPHLIVFLARYAPLICLFFSSLLSSPLLSFGLMEALAAPARGDGLFLYPSDLRVLASVVADKPS
jgi:hypothetical protein